MFKQETLDFAKYLEEEAEKFNYRLQSPDDDTNWERDNYQRDYARILYSSFSGDYREKCSC